MDILRRILSGRFPEEGLDGSCSAALSAFLGEATGCNVYPTSVVACDRKILALGRDKEGLKLLLLSHPDRLAPFTDLATGTCRIEIGGPACLLSFVPTNHAAARCVRESLSWTAPTVQGLELSVGLGDRLGLATPGHVRAVQAYPCRPYFAQQSIREMTRTQRSPQEVLDAATWGVLQAGWRKGFGSDADHLKGPADVDACAAAGFTMFTIDPGDHVRGDADALDLSALTACVELLPWDDLEATPADVQDRYLGRTFPLEGGGAVRFDQSVLARAIVKYGGAIAHTARMYRHIEEVMDGRAFELEVSVDETPTPTSAAEHFLVANELKRLGVRWVGLAPRFVGEFEKGVDYKGGLDRFEVSFAEHAAIARTLGPYKLSIHSGSDKFSIYPIAARLAAPRIHLKTAGTSYLEALRVVARRNPGLFRRIVDFAFSRFEADRRSYHVSAQPASLPPAATLSDAQLEAAYLDANDGRQLLHVTFGSVLTAAAPDGASRFRKEILDSLVEHEEEHGEVLAAHLGRHIAPFVR